MSCRSSSLKMMAIWGQKDTTGGASNRSIGANRSHKHELPSMESVCRNENYLASLTDGLIDFS